MGQRLLEIVATKIFGNPLSVAAIVNDTTFTTSNGSTNPMDQITTGFFDSMNNKRNDFFNQYVANDRVQIDQQEQKTGDFNTAYNFNLELTSIEVPMYLAGSVVDAGGAIPTTFAALLNGPVVGGNQLVSGSYNVPLLFRFHD
jgi:hypothetical protein